MLGQASAQNFLIAELSTSQEQDALSLSHLT